MAEAVQPYRLIKNNSEATGSAAAPFVDHTCDSALFENKSTKNYGYMLQTQPAPGVDPALSPCIMVQKAGLRVYSKAKMLQGNTVEDKITLNISNLAQNARSHNARLHLFNFDAGDDTDPEYPRHKEVYRFETDKVDNDGNFAVAYVDGVPFRYLAPTVKEAIEVAQDISAENHCIAVKVAEHFKQHAASARLEAVAKMEEEACDSVACSYTWLPTWDYFVPSQEDFAVFLQHYASGAENTVYVFHCGAGYGRSGLYVLAARIYDIHTHTGKMPDLSVDNLRDLLVKVYTRKSRFELEECNSTKLRAFAKILPGAMQEAFTPAGAKDH